MSQVSIASYFNSRKRAAVDEIHTSRNKVFVESDPCSPNGGGYVKKLIFKSVESTKHDLASQLGLQKSAAGQHRLDDTNQLFQNVTKDSDSSSKVGSVTRSGRAIKRIGLVTEEPDSKISNVIEEKPKLRQQKLVTFTKAGALSPRKRLTPQNETALKKAFASKESTSNVERGTKTPVKQLLPETSKEKLASLVKKELNFDEVKTKISRSAKLQELKASLNRIQELEKTRKDQEEKNKRLKNGEFTVGKKPSTISLKEFKTIELEVLSSPTKQLKTPTKTVPPAPGKNELMSPKNVTPKKILFTPTKDGTPSKLIVPAAYQRFQSLADSGKLALQMPYKYRCLLEAFKCLDSVCAMFYNRKEVITLKKLKPAVQRMLRKNFDETHLAQIKYLYPGAFNFSQTKMRNFGSLSKQDYYQLIISPNVEGGASRSMAQIDEDNVLKSAQTTAMNPQVIIDRQQKFHQVLLGKVKDEHDKFLKSLIPPITIQKEKLTRWHPEFDLEKCPEVERAILPQPPNVEKYSSAKDILSTARNLFNCATPMERAMDRLNANENQVNSITEVETKDENPVMNVLKGVPKSLLDKIRAKQAAKALDAMTRRPSQDREASKYSRLPELSRHLRNVFVTEKKAALLLEVVIEKIQNSFRTNMTPKDIECHIRLISKECPSWIQFHEVRKTMYVKMGRNIELSKIIDKLENIANNKSK